MIKGSLRSLLLGTAVSAALVASAGTAGAVEYNFGDVTMHIDTTISAGVAARTAQRDNALLPTSNGGPLQQTLGTAGGGGGLIGCVSGTLDCAYAAVPTDQVTGAGASIQSLNAVNAPTTVSASINTDDGRLNFNQWDLTSGAVKMTNDVSASFQNYKFFGRLTSYYDAVLNSSSSYDRTPLRDGQADAARDVKLLDFYVSGDYDVGGMPLNLRAGKQVISWGESTFIQNGINTFNPVDAAAVRRPASEIKEFFIPVWAVDGSIGLPYNLSLEAFYQLKWDTYAIDRAGTPFSSSDVAAIGGNVGNVSWLTGGPGGNIMQNCSNPNPINDAINATQLGDPYKSCAGLGLATYDYTHYNPVLSSLGGWIGSNTEAIRYAAGDTSVVARDTDRHAKNSGQWGLAARWYSEDLNNTEFGFYFTNTHSRLPIASERSISDTSTTTFQGYNSAGATTSAQSRYLTYAGCNAALGAAGAVSQPGQLYGAPIGLSAQQIAALNQTLSPDNLTAGSTFLAAEQLANNYYASTGAGGSSQYAVINAPSAASPFSGGIAGTNLSFLGGNYVGVTVNQNSLLEATIINCALAAMQSTQLAPGTPVMQTDGSQILLASSAAPALGLFLEYPENIHMFGASFNTTVGTWGVQGEFSFRPNAPMQLDTDQITIAALNDACVFELLLGATTMNALVGNAKDTYGGHCGSNYGNGGTTTLHGYVRSKMWTGQVGTTATYTNSNALVNAASADLGILVTEVGMVYTPDAPNETNAGSNNLRWGNVCTGGTDLPLAGFLALAPRPGCRPTKSSWGYVLLGQLQYNNAFNTAVTLSPTLAFSHDVSGNTAAPYSNYRQGRKSVSLQLNGSYQSWKAGLGYTNFFGSDKYNDAVDRDNVALNISYAF